MPRETDYADQQHFKQWCKGQRLRLDMRRAMWELFCSDPELWGNRGWSAARDYVHQTKGIPL